MSLINYRSLTLPEGIDAESVGAEFADGVLEVRIPKPAERKPHPVAIGARASTARRPRRPRSSP